MKRKVTPSTPKQQPQPNGGFGNGPGPIEMPDKRPGS